MDRGSFLEMILRDYSCVVLYFVICAIISDVATLWLRDTPLAMCGGQKKHTRQEISLGTDATITLTKEQRDYDDESTDIFKEIVIRCVYDEINEY